VTVTGHLPHCCPPRLVPTLCASLSLPEKFETIEVVYYNVAFYFSDIWRYLVKEAISIEKLGESQRQEMH
jgi:hypothetical protein